MELRLINLQCPSCGSGMDAGPHDILFLCRHCGAGALLGDEALEPLESAAILPAPGRRAELWKPGWSIEADVSVTGRRTADGRTTPDRSERSRFIIPAFPLSLTDLDLLSRALTEGSGSTGEVPREPCLGGTLECDDAVEFIRFLVIGAEVGRPDDLADVTVTVDVVSHHLVALPFERKGERLCCAVTGTVVGSV